MSLVKNTTRNRTNKAVAKDKYILGTSECYFEPAVSFQDALTPESLKKLMLNQSSNPEASTVLQESNGKSLKLTLTINHSIGGAVVPEVQHVGLVTASDFSLELDDSHVEAVLQHVREEAIVKRTDASSVLEMF